MSLCQQVEESKGSRFILGLLGSHLDRGRYMLIKESFNESLISHLRRGVSIERAEGELRSIL